LIAGLGLAGLPLSVSGAARPAPRSFVYVDKAELARLHPGWQALSDMKAALSDGAIAGRAVSARDQGVRLPSRGGSSGRSRSELAAKAALDASAALDALETRRYATLRARCDAMNSQLFASAQASWKAEARDIEQQVAEQTKADDERYASDLVNARLRASASEAACKVSKSDASGMDKAATEARLREAQGDLAGIETTAGAAKDRITAEASAKIGALEAAAQKRVAEQVAAYESEQRRLIAQDIASARGEIARELGPGSAPLLFAGSDSTDAAELSAAVSALQDRIDDDVSSVVLDLAAKRGLQVTFEWQAGAAKDATGAFAALIKKYGWPAGAVVNGRLGSS